MTTTEQSYQESAENQAEKLNYTKIPNSVLEGLCKTRIPGEAVQVLMTIIRQTYGWKKDQDKISLGLFQKKTGIDRSNALRAVKVLEDMKIIIPDRNAYITTYKINSNSQEWMPKAKHKAIRKHDVRNDCKLQHDVNSDCMSNMLSEMTTPMLSEMTTNMLSEMTLGVVKNDYKHVVNSDNNKRKKKTLTKNTHKERECELSFSLFKNTAVKMLELIRQTDQKYKEPDLNDWAAKLETLGKSPDEIESAMTWTLSHEFWSTRAKGIDNFVKHYATIRSQMGNGHSKTKPVIDYSEFGGTPKQPKINTDRLWAEIANCKNLAELEDLELIHPEIDTIDILRAKSREMKLSYPAPEWAGEAIRQIDSIKTVEQLRALWTENCEVWVPCETVREAKDRKKFTLQIMECTSAEQLDAIYDATWPPDLKAVYDQHYGELVPDDEMVQF